jgi:hypothetical protein
MPSRDSTAAAVPNIETSVRTSMVRIRSRGFPPRRRSVLVWQPIPVAVVAACLLGVVPQQVGHHQAADQAHVALEDVPQLDGSSG